MAKIPREKMNEIWRWLSLTGGSAYDIPMDANDDSFDLWADWWLDAVDEDIVHDRYLQDLVNAGELDDLDADWVVGNLDDWKPLLEERAADVRRLVEGYEAWAETGEDVLM